MSKFSIIDYAKMISEANGDEADAVLLLRVNDGESQLSIIGIDKRMISPNAIVIAETLKTLLDSEMNAAFKLSKVLAEAGMNRFRKRQHSIATLTPEEAPLYNADKGGEDAETEEDSGMEGKGADKDFARELANALIDAVFGGDDDEDDD